ncbi:hypothetical protein [Streptomyces sp. STR69]|uniref:hypothetical protein n=1 Tax=Streptomyces sp. STR69 TaxID=1796942 RepID=UPI0021C838A5|nr:hypothetical protein [Streptomyces sp. STR69]
MAVLSRQQLVLIAQAAEVLTQLRGAAFDNRTPKPPERIDIVPGVLALIVTKNQGLSTEHYALETAPGEQE